MDDPRILLQRIQTDDQPAQRKELEASIDSGKVASWLNNGNWRVRNAAVKVVHELRLKKHTGTLAAMATDRTRAPLIDRLLGGDYYQVGFIRRNAVNALGDIGEGTPETAQVLHTALGDPYWEVRAAAIRAAARLFGGETMPENLKQDIRKALRDDSFEVVVEAVKAAGEVMEDAGILEEFKRLYDHPNSIVKQTVKDTLIALHKKGIIGEDETIAAEINNIFVPGLYNNGSSE